MTDDQQAVSLVATDCPTCGRALEQQDCPQCAPIYAPPAVPAVTPKSAWWDVLWAFVVWGVSGGFLLSLDMVYRIALWLSGAGVPEIKLTPLMVLASLVVTFFMHVAGFIAAWLMVTRMGKRPFWSALGWTWPPRFKWWHAAGLALAMMGAAVLFEKILPHRETELEKILKMGWSVRLAVAALAVITAPLIEELVYRGVVFSSIERVLSKPAAVVLVTLLFTIVHVPQYWGSYAAISAILSLSLVLTLLRAGTNRLLPCVMTHMIYNGIQAVVLLVGPQQPPEQSPVPAALRMLGPWLNGG